MSFYKPYLVLKKSGDKYLISHNANGTIGFASEEYTSDNMARLIELAIKEGKRQKAAEMRTALYLEY